MSAFTPAHSAEWLKFVSTPPILTTSDKWGAKLHTMTASLTLTGAGVGTAKMFRLPAGRVRVFPFLSRLVSPAGAGSSAVHIGIAAYVDETGTAGTADDNMFADNLDGSGALDQIWPLPAVGYKDLASQDGIDIEIMVDTGNTAAAGVIFLQCTYQTAQ